jgi:DNA replicative helicase MCM subunit Mcm2 (Cdc46/Mcm family)
MDQSEFDDLMKIQRMMLSKVADESATESKLKLMDIINELVGNKNKRVQKESVILEAQSEGMMESEIERNFLALKKDGMIKDQGGYIWRS